MSFSGVTRRYGRRTVLHSLDLEVQPGSRFALVGVNGAGKTTCIKALLDLAGIDGGRIQIMGEAHDAKGARGKLAYLPERFLPPYYLRGREFLRYVARLHGNAYDEAEAASMCERLDLDPHALSRPVREYSKGMAQKLGLAATALSAKPLLVLDEPMSGLDPRARLMAKRVLLELAGAGATLFFTTHLLHDVEELCDTMGVLHGGGLLFCGAPAACRARYAAPSLEQAYLDCISLGLASDTD